MQFPISRSPRKPSRRRPFRLEPCHGEFGSGADGAAEMAHLLTALERLIMAMQLPCEARGVAESLFHFVISHAAALGITIPDKVAEIDSIADLPRNQRPYTLFSILQGFPYFSSRARSALDLRLDFLAATMGINDTER